MEFSVWGKVNISEQLDSAYLRQRIRQNEEVDKNRHILCQSIMCLKFCGALELANPGIYVGLVNFTAEIDALLAIHMKGSQVFKNYSERIIRSFAFPSQILTTELLTFFPPRKQEEWILCTKNRGNIICVHPPSRPTEIYGDRKIGRDVIKKES
nr:unnamed protein product [Callosobruchus analis]